MDGVRGRLRLRSFGRHWIDLFELLDLHKFVILLESVIAHPFE